MLKIVICNGLNKYAAILAMCIYLLYQTRRPNFFFFFFLCHRSLYSNKSFLIKGFELPWILSTLISSVANGSNRYTLLNTYRSPWLWRPRSGKIPNKSIGHIHCRRWLSHFLNIFILLQNSHKEGCYELQPIDVLTVPSPLCEIV